MRYIFITIFVIFLIAAHQATAFDVINGTPGDDVLAGTGGYDIINGYGGRDLIDGKSGNDLLKGGRGADEIWGWNGNDRIFAGPNPTPYPGTYDKLHGENGADTFGLDDGVRGIAYGGPGMDTAYADYKDVLIGIERVYRNGKCTKGC